MKALVLLILLCHAAFAQDWFLSGTVRDAEDGSRLKNVVVTLARTGLVDTTDKEGEWTLGSQVGIRSRPRVREGIDQTLTLLGGRLHLVMDGKDILGRARPVAVASGARAVTARSAAGQGDTLVFWKDGFVTRRVPVVASVQNGLEDSLRRVRYEGWVDSSHANLKADSLGGFFQGPRTMTIRWSKKSWGHMMKAMADSCGAFGTRGGDWMNATTSKPCSDGQNDYIEKSAMVWVPADIETDGRVWKNVGIRLKGNWSLKEAWTTGNYALPFRFNTDKFEDSLPVTKDQRFYGFQKISLFNSTQDPTGVRGAVASAIFRQSGVVAPYSSPVHLILKFGDTTKDVGAYEMLEVPDEPLLSRYFGNDSGNLYKPVSKLESYVASEWADPDIPGDRLDAKALIEVLNSNARSGDSARWHRQLEAAIDVDGFLRWLVASTVINSWDSYGTYPHNYYLFNDAGRFRWITYDFGNSFNYVMGSRTSIWYNEATTTGDVGTYPLIRHLLADKTYCEAYRGHVAKAIAGPAGAANFQVLVDRFGPWIASVPSASRGLAELRTFMTGRVAEVQKSLNATSCPIR